MTVFTIGYEGLDIRTFVGLLAEQYIETVVDIRELPLSRKRGFSKKALSDALGRAGYEYVHMVELGCPKPVRNRYREDGDWKRYVEGFLEHLTTQDVAIADLAERVGTSNCALLCYESDHARCHRSLVADAVQAFCGAGVHHINFMSSRTASPAGDPPGLASGGRSD